VTRITDEITAMEVIHTGCLSDCRQVSSEALSTLRGRWRGGSPPRVKPIQTIPQLRNALKAKSTASSVEDCYSRHPLLKYSLKFWGNGALTQVHLSEE
jgi:hypothetical protein